MYLKTFSLPEDRWQLMNPKDVPFKRKETPTAPLFPDMTKKTQPQTSRSSKTHFVLIDHALTMEGNPPNVFPRPVLTLAVFTWLMQPSCSGFTNTASLIFQRDCTATYRTRNHITIDGKRDLQPDKPIREGPIQPQNSQFWRSVTFTMDHMHVKINTHRYISEL